MHDKCWLGRLTYLQLLTFIVVPHAHMNMSGPISSRLFNAIMIVESGGNISAIGDDDQAIGPFQIHENYWRDAVRQDPTLEYGGKTYRSCIGVGSVAYSMRVMQVRNYC